MVLFIVKTIVEAPMATVGALEIKEGVEQRFHNAAPPLPGFLWRRSSRNREQGAETKYDRALF